MRHAVSVQAVSVEHESVMRLHPVSFDVPPGACVAITGSNGSGKTTLLKVLAARIAPTSGRALAGDEPVDDRSASYRRFVSSLIGVPAYYDDLTVADHLELLARVWRLPQPAPVLHELGIEFLAGRFPGELSSGQQQLFHLALALGRPAAVLILDEPEQRLDGDRRALLAQVLRARLAVGVAVVMATHDESLAREVASTSVRLSADARDAASDPSS